jgi:hypothetical protein
MTADSFFSNTALRIAACLGALALTACSVSAGGSIPCADDSSCPSDYPVCQAGKCVAGTPTNTEGVKIVSVNGANPATTPHVNGAAVHIMVSARATSGVASVTLTAGPIAATLTTGSSAPVPPLYDFVLDTTKVDSTTPAGVSATLTATVTAGDGTSANDTATITVDNTGPVLTGPAGAALATNTANALVGTQVYVDVVSNEPLATLTGSVQHGSATPLAMSEIDSGAAGVRRLAFSVSQATQPGVYLVSITATDAAGNSSTYPTTAGSVSFSVGVAISASLVLSGHLDTGNHNVLLNGLPAATNGDAVTATLTLLPANITLAAGFPKFSVTRPDASTASVTVDSTGHGVFNVSANSAAADGIYTFTAIAQSADGAVATASAQFVVSRAGPKVVGDTSGVLVTPSYAGPLSNVLTIQFSTDSTPASKKVTVNGNTDSIVTNAGNTFTYTYMLAASDLPTTPAVTMIPVVVDVKDALGNDSNYSVETIIDNLPPTLSSAVSAAVGGVTVPVIAANSLVNFTFAIKDAGGKVGANPVVKVHPNALGAGNPALFVSRTDAGDTSTFTYQYQVSVADSEGLASVEINATDAALNALAVTQPAVFTIDHTAPALTGIAIDNQIQSKGGSVTITVSERDCDPTAAAPTIAFVDGTGATVASGAMTGTGAPSCSTPVLYSFTHVVGTETGQVTATVTVLDRAGNGSAQSISYTVDNAVPALLAASNFSPTTNNTGTTTFTVVASKPLSSATSVSVVAQGTSVVIGNGGLYNTHLVTITPVSAANVEFPCTTCAFAISGLVPVTGTSVVFNAVVTLVDTVQHANSSAPTTSTSTFTVDKVAPTANGFAVSPAVVRTGGQVSITGTASKPLSAVTVSTSDLDVTNQACSFAANNKFTCLITVGSGKPFDQPAATVILTDAVGNASAPISVPGAASAGPGTYVVDNGLPVFSSVVVGIGSPPVAATFFKAGATVSLQALVRDCELKTVTASVNYTVGVTPTSVQMTLANTPGTGSCGTDATYLFTHVVGTSAVEPEGTVVISVQATDYAGNVSTASAQYVVDNTAPTILANSAFTPATTFTGGDVYTLVVSEPAAISNVAVYEGSTAYTDGSSFHGTTAHIIVAPATGFNSNYTITLSGFKNTGSVATLSIHATLTDQAGNSNNAVSPTSLTSDGTSNGITISPVVSPVYLNQTKQSTVSITGQANRPLKSVVIAGLSSGDTGSCGIGSDTVSVTCVINVSATDGTRSNITLTLTDTQNNVSPQIPVPSYTADSIVPVIGAVSFLAPVLNAAGLPTYSTVAAQSLVTLRVPVSDCDVTTTVNVSAVYPTGATVPFAAQQLNTNGGNCTTGLNPTVNTLSFTHVITAADPDGVTTLNIVAVDRVGNESRATATYVVDKTPPTLAGLSFSSSRSNTGTVTLTASFSEAIPITSTTLQLASTGNSNVSATTLPSSPCMSLCTFTFTGLSSVGSDVVFSAAGSLRDYGGNVTAVAPATPTYENDTTSPTFTITTPDASPFPTYSKNAGFNTFTVVGTSSKSLTGGSVTVNFGGSGDSGSCSIGPASTAITCVITVANSSGSSLTTATFTLTDALGNSLSSTTFRYNVDNTAPSLSGITATPSTATKGQSVVVTGTASEALGAATVTSTNGDAGSCVFGAGSAPVVTCTIAVSSSSSGTPTVSIVLTDKYGNVSGAAANQTTYTVDDTAPTFTVAPVATPTKVARNQTLTVSATASEALSSATVALTPPGDTAVCTVSTTNVNCTITVSATASSGAVNAVFTLVDKLGNTSAGIAANSLYTVDATAPVAGAIAVGAGANATTRAGTVYVKNGGTVTFSGTANETLGTSTVTTNHGETGSCVISTGSTYLCTVTVTDSAAADNETATLLLVDSVGNVASSGNTATFKVDNAAPTFTFATPAYTATQTTTDGSATTGSVVAVTFTVADVGAGVDTSATPTVTIGGIGAACVLTGSSYTCSRTLASSDTTGTFEQVSISGIKDLLGQTAATDTSLSIPVDLNTPTIPGLVTYLVTTNGSTGAGTTSSGTVNGSVSLTSANGATTVSVYKELGAINLLSTSSVTVATTQTTATPVPFSVPVSDAGQTGSVYVKVVDAHGLAMSPLKASGSRTVTYSLPLQALGLRSSDSTTRPVPSPIPAAVAQTDFSTTITNGSTIVTGAWETATAPTGTAPTARMRSVVAYDSASRRLVVTGGLDASGTPVADGNTYVLDMAANAWSTAGGAAKNPANATVCTAATSPRWDAAATFVSPYIVVRGGRCDKAAPTPANLNDVQTFNSSAAAGAQTWTPVTVASVTATGAMGGIVGSQTPNVFVGFGFDDGAASSTTNNLSAITLSSSSAGTSTETNSNQANRFGVGASASWAGANFDAVFVGGFAAQTSTIAAGPALNETHTVKFTGGTLAIDTPSFGSAPLARAYPAIAAQNTAGNSILITGGIANECLGSGNGANSNSHITSGAACGAAAPIDELWELSPTSNPALTWQRRSIPAIGLLPAESGGSFNGFYDSTSSAFYVYRPLAATMSMLPLYEAPRVLLKFVTSGDITGATALTLTLTTSASSNVGTGVLVWDNTANANAGGWDGAAASAANQAAAAGSNSQSTAATRSATIANPARYISATGVIYFLVEPGTIAATLDNKQLFVSNPTLSVTAPQ